MLRCYVALLKKWNVSINLFGKTTTSEIWTRHILDSAQLFDLLPEGTEHLVDLGSGAGFPGLVLAILGAETAPQRRITLIEADARKAAFLRTAVRELGLSVTVVNQRIEDVGPLDADVMTARALARLPRLLVFAERHLTPGGTALFPKGANYRAEIKEALAGWRFSREEVPSLTADGAAIIKVGALARV